MEEELRETVGKSLNAFREITSDTLSALLKLQESRLQVEFDKEKAELTERIAKQGTELQTLKTELARTKLKKLKTHRWAFVMFDKVNDIKTVKTIMEHWKFWTRWNKRKNRLNLKMVLFNRGKTAKAVFSAWRDQSIRALRANKARRLQALTNLEVAEATKEANQELQMLRKMVDDLSEDIRNETKSKNLLKYQYEQALLRGMSALNMENSSLQQSESQHLMFTP